jgi:hypothetical protein
MTRTTAEATPAVAAGVSPEGGLELLLSDAGWRGADDAVPVTDGDGLLEPVDESVCDGVGLLELVVDASCDGVALAEFDPETRDGVEDGEGDGVGELVSEAGSSEHVHDGFGVSGAVKL